MLPRVFFRRPETDRTIPLLGATLLTSDEAQSQVDQLLRQVGSPPTAIIRCQSVHPLRIAKSLYSVARLGQSGL